MTSQNNRNNTNYRPLNLDNASTNQKLVEYYNFTGTTLGVLKRFRNYKGTYYVDLVVAVQRKRKEEQLQNQKDRYVTYSSLRVMDPKDVALLKAVDEETGGVLSSHERNNSSRVVVNIGDLAVRGHIDKNGNARSCAVGRMLKILHLSVDNITYTGDENGEATTIKSTFECPNQEPFYSDEWMTFHPHAFQGVGFINRVYVNKDDNESLKLSVTFLHGRKDEANKTRAFVHVPRAGEVGKLLENTLMHNGVMNDDNEIYRYNIPKGVSLFLRCQVNVIGTNAWTYQLEKDNSVQEMLGTAIETRMVGCSYLSVSGEVLISNNEIQTVEELEDSSSSKIQERIAAKGYEQFTEQQA